MSKGDACFYCNNCCNQTIDDIGWKYDCNLGIENTEFKNKSTIQNQCSKFDSREGFQIGGYYTHMHFVNHSPDEPNSCLEWMIQGDLNFPKSDPTEFTSIHLCDFRQIEEWVKYWGTELRRRGWVKDDE